ncbi:MAG: hypothetical protein Q4G07_04230 [Oscillospiraceae bacterium]|nr:hypothetical protein [Oscillospiraceae bacterium]
MEKAAAGGGRLPEKVRYKARRDVNEHSSAGETGKAFSGAFF